MYKDSVITVVSDLAFYGKAFIHYSEISGEKVCIQSVLNKDRSVTTIKLEDKDIGIDNMNFRTISELAEYLEKIKDRIYLIAVDQCNLLSSV